MSIDDIIIEIYCKVSDAMKKIFGDKKIRTRGYEPKLTDEEVITMELVGEYLGKSKDSEIWLYFKSHYKEWFPNLGHRTTFLRQSANLHKVKSMLHQYFIQEMKADKSEIYVADGFPIPTHLRSRANRSKNFKGEAGYGYCASKDLKYYGFKGLFLINQEGVVADVNIVCANIDEREALMDMSLKGSILADKGYISADLKQDLAKYNINLITPSRNNMNKKTKFTQIMFKTRRLIETVIGQFVDRFNIQKTRAKDLWHLISRIYRKVLCHTLCIMINRSFGNNLNIAKLISY